MTWKIDCVHTSAEFSVRHMMVAKVRGRFGKVEGTINLDEEIPARSTVELVVDVTSIDTGEPERDAHLRSPDFFDTENFPVMTYKSRSIERHGDSYRVVGDLTIRNITREVVLDVKFAGVVTDPYGDVRAGFSVEATINRKDFGLRWNVPLDAGGVMVGDTVTISVEAEAVKQASVCKPSAKMGHIGRVENPRV